RSATRSGRTGSSRYGSFLSRYGCAREHIGHDSRAGAPPHLRVGDEEEAVPQHRGRLRFHVVGKHVRATADRSMRLRRAIERKSRTRTRAELDAFRGPRRSDDIRDIAAHRVAHADRPDLVAQRYERARVEDRSQVIGGYRPRSMDAKDVVLFFRVRVTELEHEKETVELRLRKRERSLELDRVLRRDHAERLGKR